MTDYTPAPETPAEKSLKYCETEYRLLIREAARLKKERDELLEIAESLLFLCSASDAVYETESDIIIQKAEAVIKRAEK